MEKILILGGTGFVGRILTENLITSGNNPVLFNRGKRNPDLFPELRLIKGDRLSDDIKQITNENWDIVIDFSCMFPDNLEEILNILKGKVGRYIFISTLSVYPMDDPEFWKNPVDEDARVLECTPEQRKNPDVNSTYGEKKAECERILLGRDDLDFIIFRPGLIYGRYDYTDRFYYWLYRAKAVSKILMPDNGKERFTATHSEDFAKLIEAAIWVDKHNKLYNAVTHSPVSLKHYVEESAKLLDTKPELINAGKKFIENENLVPWADLPAWVGSMDLCVDNSRAIKDFPVKFVSFNSSLKSCIDYYSSLNWPEPKTGLSTEREIELVQKLIN